MAKYEVMLVIKGDIDEKSSKNTLNELVKILKVSDIKITELGLKELAYEIKKQTKGWYYQLNFESNNQEAMNEFRRLSRINKNLLRQLIINLEKDYGYKASINPKKIEKNKNYAAYYQKKQEEQKNQIKEKNLSNN